MKKSFKNAAWVVDLFNQSVTHGQQYLEAKELDDTFNMNVHLQDFAITLGSTSEIAVRYLLYKYENYDGTEEKETFYSLWNRLGQSSLLPQLQKLGFFNNNRKDILAKKDIRDFIYNEPKHLGSLSEAWREYYPFYEELRRLISNFVVSSKTASLQSFNTSYKLPDTEEWENVLNSAFGFQKNNNYKYILITDRIKYRNALDIFKIPWSMILDFDIDTDEPGGLYYEFQHNQVNVIAELYKFNDRLTNSSSALHWVSVAIKDNAGNRYADRALSIQVSKHLRKFIDKYHSYHSEPVIVIVSMDDESYRITLNKTVEIIYETYYNETANNESDVHFLLLKNSSIDLFVNDERLLEKFDIGIRQVIEGAAKEIADKPIFNGKYLMPAKNENGETQVEMSKEQCSILRQYAEPVFYGIEQEETEDSLFKPIDFYQGSSHITWKMLAENNIAMVPDVLSRWISEIESAYNKPGTPRYIVYCRRGMGGTTCLRMLAYAMHEKHPTIIVHKYVRGCTADEIVKLYSLCNKPLLILIDSNQLYNEEVAYLREELKSKTFSFVTVWFIGYSEYSHKGSLPALRELNGNELKSMVDIIKKNTDIPAKRDLLDFLNIDTLNKKIGDTVTPFLFNMCVFEDDFPGIRNYVENTLKFPEFGGNQRSQIKKWEDILFVIALAGWAGFSVNEQSFIGTVEPKMLERMHCSDSPLSPLIVYSNNNGEDSSFQLRHYQFSAYILAYFSGGIGKNIRFSGLTDRIIEFIKNSRVDMSRSVSEETIRLLRRLFINRDWDSSNYSTGNTQNSQVYSAIICKMIEEHKEEIHAKGYIDAYDPEADGILRIYMALTKYYPDEIHFHAHLARYYFYTAHDYKNGIREIDKALEIIEDDPECSYADKSLVYHIKGMGFRAKVYNTHIRSIRKLLEKLCDHEISNKNVEVQITDALQEMWKDVQQADFNFKESEKYGADNAVYALISICQLHIELQRLYVDIKKRCSEYGLPTIIDEKVFVENADLLACNNDELQVCYNFFEDDLDLMAEDTSKKAKKKQTLIQDINADVISFTRINDDVIKFCLQCINDDTIQEKAHYRHLVAQMKLEAITDDIGSEESQAKIREIVNLYEENIAENPGSGTDIRNWFNAVRKLSCDCESALDILEECRRKLDQWIDSGNASRDAYLYRYIVRFLVDYENSSLDSSESHRSLEQMRDDVKRHAETLPTKTKVIFWIGHYGYGLNRLIANSDFQKIGLDDRLKTLEMMEGKLPEKSKFKESTAYISLCGHSVFFRPSAVTGAVSTVNSGAFINFGLGFSYDGLRSYHDSIQLISKKLLTRDHCLGDHVLVQVYNHNKTWVECLVQGEDQPVIISKDSLSSEYDPENNIWPEPGDVLEVILVQHRNYKPQGRIFIERNITKEPYVGTSV